MANLFTEEQQAILNSNPYTLSVDAYRIRYTVEFKQYLLSEIEKPDVSFRDAFKKAGYDPEMLGYERMKGAVKIARAQAASPRGLHETGPSKEKLSKIDLKKKRTQTAIKELQDEVVKLRQEIEFLKKISILADEENNTP